MSPGKTWEGVYGGLAAVAVYALALVPLVPRDRVAVLESGVSTREHVERALDAGGSDNITVIVVELPLAGRAAA